MTFHHNKKIRKKFFVQAIILLAVLSVAILLGGNGILSGLTVSLASPIFSVRDSIGNWYESKSYLIKDKEILADENSRLKKDLAEKEIELMSFNILKKENDELNNFLGRKTKERESVVARVLLRPPQVPYDILIIDVGEDSGIKEGMIVSAYGDILLGFVDEVFKGNSRVKLYSNVRENIDILIDNTNIFAVASGGGGGNFEITIPRAEEVKEGSIVITPGADPFVLGIVELVKADMADAFQKVLFRTPLNIQELKWVEVSLDLSPLSPIRETQDKE